MITSTENKAFKVVIDGSLGGCGYGPVGDPRTFVPEVWETLLESIRPESVLDIGCGFGYSTRWFDEHGCDAVGLEGSVMIAEQAVTSRVRWHDFTQGPPLDLPEFDLCWCCEFLEHVEEHHLPHVFAALARCRYVAATAALPGQGGHHHVNERPRAYWIEQFERHGFRYVPSMTVKLQEVAKRSGEVNFFTVSGMFFERVRVIEPDPETERSAMLGKLAKGRRVLTMGADGPTLRALAVTAKQVTAIGITNDGRSCGVEPIEGTLQAASEEITRRRFDLVYVGDDPALGTTVAVSCLLPGGIVLWEDFESLVVRSAVEKAGIPVEHINAKEGIGIMLTGRNQTAVSVPHSGTCGIESLKAAWRACDGRYADRGAFIDNCCGGLTHNFNTILGHALNWRDRGNLTHLAMIHTDVSAPPGWVDVLSEEMCLTRAVAISAVVAIKDPDDDRTSTAIGSADDPWEPVRYIRNRDHGRIPDTFGGADVCGEGEVLLINTGCMLLDLRHEFWDTFVFRVYNRIIMKDGLRYPQFRPEDWEMSRELHAAGLPYAATWKVETKHHGQSQWPNRAEGARVLRNA